MNRKQALIASGLGCLFTLSAHANIVTFTGNTSTGGTYNRVDVDANGTPTGLSATGTAVQFSVYNFNVATAGDFSFITAGAYDSFATLYGGSFSSGSPLTNALTGNDDLLGKTTSGFEASLGAGSYSYVVSSFLNGASGYFTTTIGDEGSDGVITPGTVSVVTPDPKVLTFGGTTVGAPTYGRADSTAALSSDGSSVGYRTVSFQVGTTGSYAFTSTGSYDTFLSLYGGTFDPAHATTNLLQLNDDYFADTSALKRDLVPNVTYTLVQSAYSNGEAGLFSDTISGPGAVRLVGLAVVPEPGVVALMFGGLGAMAVRRRRKVAA